MSVEAKLTSILDRLRILEGDIAIVLNDVSKTSLAVDVSKSPVDEGNTILGLNGGKKRTSKLKTKTSTKKKAQK